MMIEPRSTPAKSYPALRTGSDDALSSGLPPASALRMRSDKSSNLSFSELILPKRLARAQTKGAWGLSQGFRGCIPASPAAKVIPLWAWLI